MAELYVTYTSRSRHGMAHGRKRISLNDPNREFTFSEIELIEATMLEDSKKTEPSTDLLFVTDWRWLTDEASASSVPSDTP